MKSEDVISRQAVLSMQYRIDDSATLSMRDVVNVNDIEDLPPVTPQPKYEDIAKAFQLGLAFGFGEKHDEMDKVIEEVKKAIEPKPKTGRWILTQRDKYIDISCSECRFTRVKEFAYGYTIDEIDMEEFKEFVVRNKMNYCECCGARMQEAGK